MRFSKYHGLGNDFVVVDLRATDAATTAAIQEPAVVQAVCDRQFGVGGAGILALLPGNPGSITRKRVLNADGSEAEMCGNGSRCGGEELARAGSSDRVMAIDTGAGKLTCERIANGVTVEMGAPRLTRGEIPLPGPAAARCLAQAIEAKGKTFHVTGVSMGNPHAIIFVADPAANLRTLAETYGPPLELHPMFPARTHVELVRIRSRTALAVVVWARGVGITLACGTGACATVVAAILNARCAPETDVAVTLLGGTLTIRVLANLANVRMAGPALHVFAGQLDPRAVSPRPTA